MKAKGKYFITDMSAHPTTSFRLYPGQTFSAIGSQPHGGNKHLFKQSKLIGFTPSYYIYITIFIIGTSLTTQQMHSVSVHADSTSLQHQSQSHQYSFPSIHRSQAQGGKNKYFLKQLKLTYIRLYSSAQCVALCTRNWRRFQLISFMHGLLADN